MANFAITARSSYFKVKDEDAFVKWLGDLDSVQLHTKIEDDKLLFMIMNDDGNGWPTEKENKDGEYEDIDFADELAKHLAVGWVCQLIEIGQEKMRYLHGYIQAFNNEGDRVSRLLEFDNCELNQLGKYHTAPTY